MSNPLQQSLFNIRDDLYAYAGLVTNADKSAIEARTAALMAEDGWTVLDDNEAILNDADESILIKVRNGKQEAVLYLKWEMADGSVGVNIDTDGDGA